MLAFAARSRFLPCSQTLLPLLEKAQNTCVNIVYIYKPTFVRAFVCVCVRACVYV